MTNICMKCKKEFKRPWMLKRHYTRITPCKEEVKRMIPK